MTNPRMFMSKESSQVIGIRTYQKLNNQVYLRRHKYVLGPTQIHFSPALYARGKMESIRSKGSKRTHNTFMPKNINCITVVWRALRKQQLKKGQSGGYFFTAVTSDKTATNGLAQLVFNTLLSGVQKIPIRRSFRYKFILPLSPFTPALLVPAQISIETFKVRALTIFLPAFSDGTDKTSKTEKFLYKYPYLSFALGPSVYSIILISTKGSAK